MSSIFSSKSSKFHFLTPFPCSQLGLDWMNMECSDQNMYIFCQTQLQLADPTQFQLVVVGVDFVFPLEEEEEEGRRRNNPHLAFSRRNDPTCLHFADCLLGALRVLGNCLEGVWKVS